MRTAAVAVVATACALAAVTMNAAASPAALGSARGDAAMPMLDPARVSFLDMVRLAGGAPLLAEAPAAQAPLRLALAAPEAEAPRFVVRPAREPERWLLLLSGLAAAGWVARRRLAAPL